MFSSYDKGNYVSSAPVNDPVVGERRPNWAPPGAGPDPGAAALGRESVWGRQGDSPGEGGSSFFIHPLTTHELFSITSLLNPLVLSRH